MINGNPGISPTHNAGVGVVGGMDVGSDKGSNSELFEDSEDDVVPDADGPDAAEEASKDGTAEGKPVEEAPMKLPKNPPKPRLKNEKSTTILTCRIVHDARSA